MKEKSQQIISHKYKINIYAMPCLICQMALRIKLNSENKPTNNRRTNPSEKKNKTYYMKVTFSSNIFSDLRKNTIYEQFKSSLMDFQWNKI